MKLRNLAPFVLATAGCAGILGIPSDVDRDDGTSTNGAEADTEASTTDAPTGTDAPSGTDASDGGVDAPVDAPEDAPMPIPCSLTKDFGTPELVGGTISTAEQEGSPRLSPDELTIYFDGIRSATNGPYFGLFTATRATTTSDFGPVSLVPGDVNTTIFHEFAPNITADGLTMFFERQDPNPPYNNDFWTSSRPNLVAPFAGGVQIAGVNTPDYEGKLFVPVDENELYFTRQLPNGNHDIHVAKKGPNGYVVTVVPNINSPSLELAPVVSRDGLVIYFSSTRFAVAGKTDENIWVATRASKNDPFGDPVFLPTVNLPGVDEEPGYISTDGCRLYFMSNPRPGSVGQQDIWVATRPK